MCIKRNKKEVLYRNRRLQEDVKKQSSVMSIKVAIDLDQGHLHSGIGKSRSIVIEKPKQTMQIDNSGIDISCVTANKCTDNNSSMIRLQYSNLGQVNDFINEYTDTREILKWTLELNLVGPISPWRK
jgi:hypothetical protein